MLCWIDSPMLSKVPDERLERRLVEALAHPVERRAEVVDQLLAGELLSHVSRQLGGLGDVGVSSLNPQKIGVRSELLCPLRSGGEARAVVVVSFTGAGNVTRPENGSLGVVICKLAATGEGQVRVLLNLCLVCVPCALRSAFGLEVLINSWMEPLVNVNHTYKRNIPSSKVTSLCLLTQSNSYASISAAAAPSRSIAWRVSARGSPGSVTPRMNS